MIVTTAETCAQLVKEKKILPNQINLVIVDQCHKSLGDSTLDCILRYFLSSEDVPRIVGLAVPLFNLTKIPGRIGLEIERIEALFQCEIETGSDIISILRLVPSRKKKEA